MQSLFCLFFIRRYAVPMEITLHKRHALARNSPGDNNRRAVKHGLGPADRFDNGRKIMAVYFLDMPAETFEFMRQRFERHHVFGIAVDLDIIAVDDGDQIAESVFCRRQTASQLWPSSNSPSDMRQ